MGDDRDVVTPSNIDVTSERKTRRREGRLNSVSPVTKSASVRWQQHWDDSVSALMTTDLERRVSRRQSVSTTRSISRAVDAQSYSTRASRRQSCYSTISSLPPYGQSSEARWPAARRQSVTATVSEDWAVSDRPTTVNDDDDDDEYRDAVTGQLESADAPPSGQVDMWDLFTDFVRSISSTGVAQADFRPKHIPKRTSDLFRQVREDLASETEKAQAAAINDQPQMLPAAAAGRRRAGSRQWTGTWKRAASISTVTRAMSVRSDPKSASTAAVANDGPEPTTSVTDASSSGPKSRGWKILRRQLHRERMTHMMIPTYKPWNILERRSARTTDSTEVEAWQTRWRLYERYVDGTDPWDEGLSESGSDRLHDLQQAKTAMRRRWRPSVSFHDVTSHPAKTALPPPPPPHLYRAMSAHPARRENGDNMAAKRRVKSAAIMRSRSSVLTDFHRRQDLDYVTDTLPHSFMLTYGR